MEKLSTEALSAFAKKKRASTKPRIAASDAGLHLESQLASATPPKSVKYGRASARKGVSANRRRTERPTARTAAT
jgi:hypothetical protein